MYLIFCDVRSKISFLLVALTSYGICLQVLAIMEGVEDVYILGKEAAAAHSALMADLSKVFCLE